MTITKSFLVVRAEQEVQEGRRTSVGVDAKHDVYDVTKVSKKLFLVVEGPDCSGKSTLVEQLAKTFDLPLEKNLRIKNPQAIIRSLAEQIVFAHPRKTGKGTIKDRWQYPSDIIYEEIHGRTESILVDWEPSLIKELHYANVLFLYVKADAKELVRRRNIRGDDEINDLQLIQLADMYENFFNDPKREGLSVAVVDTTNLSPDEVYHVAMDKIMRHYEEEAK